MKMMPLAEHDDVVLAAHASPPSARRRRSFTPAPSATRSNVGPNFSSRSRIRNLGATPSIVALRSCCAVHSWVGWRVAARWTTRREPCFTRKKRNKGRNIRSYVCTNSQHQMSAAWFFTKVDQVWPPRRRYGGGMYFWMVRLLTRIPSFR